MGAMIAGTPAGQFASALGNFMPQQQQARPQAQMQQPQQQYPYGIQPPRGLQGQQMQQGMPQQQGMGMGNMMSFGQNTMQNPYVRRMWDQQMGPGRFYSQPGDAYQGPLMSFLGGF